MSVLQIALDAAEKGLGMDQFLTPQEITYCDENSMIVYLSEYYSAIVQWKKYDIQKRTHSFTKTSP
jgi:hypothetical protein